MSEAAALLVHYFQTVWQAAGLKWDSDNEAEVQAIIESLEPPSQFSPERQKQRQRIASEQLAALIMVTIQPENFSAVQKSKHQYQLVKDAVYYADLLLEELDKAQE